MNSRGLIRNADAVLANLKELADGSVVTLKGCKIYVPKRFAERGMLQLGTETHTCGVYLMTFGDKYYAVSLVNAFITILPSGTTTTKMGDEEYYEFSFNPGATVMKTLDLVQQDSLVYRIYDELFSKANIPWYIEYEDLGKIFDTAKKHAGTDIGSNAEVTELLVSLISRNAADRTQYYRTVIESREDLKKNPPAYIPLRSVTFASTNTTNKLAGSYFSEGVTGALVYPAERVENVEKLLKA